MNWTKGLFRIWIIASVGIVLSVAGFSYPEVKKEFETWNLLKLMQANDILMVPVHCAEARGRKEQDYFQAHARSELTRTKPCWYELPKFRELYPEYAQLTEKETSRKFYAKAGIPRNEMQTPWAFVFVRTMIALGLSITLLMVGVSIRWAWRGFRENK